MSKNKKYNLSFAGYSLKINDLVSGAKLLSTGEKIDKIELGDGNSATGIRKAREVLKRLKVLTNEQLELLYEYRTKTSLLEDKFNIIFNRIL